MTPITKINHIIMKRALHIIFISLLLLGTVSCSDKDGYDDRPTYNLFPTYIEISVSDSDGNNLCDPKHAGNILNSGITLQHNDNTYSFTCDGEIFMNNGMDSSFKGIMLNPINNTLIIGFHNQLADISRNEYVVNWGNGFNTVITYSQKITDNGKHVRPTVTTKCWIDGVESELLEPDRISPWVAVTLWNR